MLPFKTIARRVSALAVAVALLVPVLAQPAPARADGPVIRDHRDPDSRLELVIRKLIVHDDMDWGDGDIRLNLQVRMGASGCELDGCANVLVDASFPEVHASDGDVVTLDRVVPRSGVAFGDPRVGEGIGIPIRAGNAYTLTIVGTEVDTTSDDTMGFVYAHIVNESGRPRLGVHTERSAGKCGTFFCQAGGDATFSVEYEIREPVLPDLRAVGVTVHDVPGSTQKRVCMAVQNIGLMDISAFEVALQVDGEVVPNGRIPAGSLASGRGTEVCLQTALPTSGQHRLTAAADDRDILTEVSETNNRYEEPYLAARVSGPGSTVADPSVSKTDEDDPRVVLPAASPTPAPTRPAGRPATRGR
jgi:hypothetical protein